MTTAHATNPAAPATPARSAQSLVWDAPVRVVHWLLVVCMAGAWITAERDALALVHVTLGWTFVALALFRLLWGIIGPRTARFTSFVRGPAAVGAYLRSMLAGRPQHHEGHNPLGALAILAMLALAVAIGLSAWAMGLPGLGHAAKEVHEAVTGLLMAVVVVVHVGGVLLASLLHRENLVRAMITGRKGDGTGIRRAWRPLAAALLAAVLAFWALQWQTAPAGGLVGVPAVGREGDRHGDIDRDGDDD